MQQQGPTYNTSAVERSRPGPQPDGGMDDLAKEIVGRWERLEPDRQVFKSHWQQCADYMLPERNDCVSSRTPGQRRMTKVYDATPIWANQQFAAGMHSFLTSSWRQWFSL
jgi:hypothetical protein